MATKSVYLPQPAVTNSIIQITDEEHRHLAVARAELGEQTDVFDGRGHVWVCEVVDVAKRHTSLKVIREWDSPAPRVELILALALIHRPAFELALEKAVETGVTRIIPLVASRSNIARADRSGRSDRWQRIVVEAAKQSKRFHLPRLDAPVPFAQTLQVEAGSKIMFAEHNGSPLKSAVAGSPVLYLVGPEGGWTDDELSSARDAGFHMVSLGSGILRSETVAIVGAALIRYELGDM
jgi:16S rRNA (uracil1498-N3)-methyltransferase